MSLVSGAVLVVELLVMLTALYTALIERHREIAVLRTLGLHARQIFALFILESTLISAVGAALGLAAAYAVSFLVRIPVENNYDIPLALVGLSLRVAYYMIAVVGAGALLGFIPAIRAYRNALVDGLNAG
ncbi:MAG: FtsX-like permease family protein [Acidobacteriaceae bacterium]